MRLDVSGLKVCQINAHGMGATWKSRASLGGDLLTLFISFVLQLIVLLDSLQEFISAG